MTTRNFNNSMDILVKAYFNGHLRHNTCSACAVGNLVMDLGNGIYNQLPQPSDIVPEEL